jgi:3-methyladenine DNA glycosylase AlkD
MAELRRLGKPNTAKIYARHGVSEKTVGLAYADLKNLVKRLGTQHELAHQLWESGVHDARVLATKISDPARVSAQQLEKWLSDASNYIVTGAVAGLAAKGQAAVEIAKEWIQSAQEWRSSAGWSVLTEAALSGKLSDADSERLLETIRERIHDAANRTRYSMNNTLIAIGGANERLRPLALKVAESIGRVEVDHGQTGCKTPDARSYIGKMVEHGQRKKR